MGHDHPESLNIIQSKHTQITKKHMIHTVSYIIQLHTRITHHHAIFMFHTFRGHPLTLFWPATLHQVLHGAATVQRQCADAVLYIAGLGIGVVFPHLSSSVGFFKWKIYGKKRGEAGEAMWKRYLFPQLEIIQMVI